MHLHLPKPLHGWREFLGEVGIIVLGVLIALGAQQLVEAAHGRSEVRSFRKSVDHELGRNLGIFQQVMVQRSCATRRLADLERFLADSVAGRQDRIVRPIGRPFVQTGYFSVWDNKGGDVVDNLSLNLRLQYGEIYDEFRNNEVIHLNERDVWRSLSQFQQPEPLDHADRMRLRELLTRAEQFNASTRPNYEYILTLARALGIKPIGDSQLKAPGPTDSFCQPLLAAK